MDQLELHVYLQVMSVCSEASLSRLLQNQTMFFSCSMQLEFLANNAKVGKHLRCSLESLHCRSVVRHSKSGSSSEIKPNIRKLPKKLTN